MRERDVRYGLHKLGKRLGGSKGGAGRFVDGSALEQGEKFLVKHFAFWRLYVGVAGYIIAVNDRVEGWEGSGFRGDVDAFVKLHLRGIVLVEEHV